MDVHERTRALWLLLIHAKLAVPGLHRTPCRAAFGQREANDRVTTCPEDILEVRRTARHYEMLRVRGDGRYSEELQVKAHFVPLEP